MTVKRTIKDAMNEERLRILTVLQNTEPGTKEYRELQNQLGAYEIISQKMRDGKMTERDWITLGFQLVTMGVIVYADQIMPNVIGKVRVWELGRKLFLR